MSMRTAFAGPWRPASGMPVGTGNRRLFLSQACEPLDTAKQYEPERPVSNALTS